MSKGKKSAKAKARELTQVAAEPDFGLTEFEDKSGPEKPVDRPNPVRLLADAAVRLAMGEDLVTRLNEDRALLVAVRAPTPAWVKQIESSFKRLRPRAIVIGRDGSDRLRHKADFGNETVAEAVAEGRQMIGVATSVGFLPSSLVSGADVTIDVKIDGTVIADAIARFVGDARGSAAASGLGALDFGDLVVGFRAGSSADEIIARLTRAASRLSPKMQDRLPRLEDAVEFGAAREWGLDLGVRWTDQKARAAEHGTQTPAPYEISGNCVWVGEPGLGKTFFAQVLAKHLGVPLVSGSLSEIFATTSGYLDTVVKGVRDLFARAEATGSALFIDEIDSLPSRVNLDSRHLSWWGPVVAEFLLLLDSSRTTVNKPRFVWAATNHVDRLDPALIRPGRLDRVIRFGPPGPDGIASIVRRHLDGDLPDVDLAAVGQLGLGKTPAELAAIVKSARSAARAERRPMTADDLFEALAPRVAIDDATLRRIAIHESGHAVVCMALGIDEVVAIDAIGSTTSWGRTLMRREDGLETRGIVEARATVNLGGRAAETVVYDGDCSINAGGDATSDLALATDAVCALRVSMGLGDGIAFIAGREDATKMLRVDHRLRTAVEEDLARLHARAVDIVTRHRAALEAIADALISRRHLTGTEARGMFAAHPPAK